LGFIDYVDMNKEKYWNTYSLKWWMIRVVPVDEHQQQ